MSSALTALSVLFTPSTILIIIVASVIGVIVSALPGISAINAMALLIPVSFAMSPEHALPFLIAIMGAAGFAGSVTSILLNVPGDITNAATLMDGFGLTRKGRAAEAIGLSALASILGALIGVVVLAILLPVVKPLVLTVGPSQMFAMAIVGIALISLVGAEGYTESVLSGLWGMAFAFVGFSLTFGGTRFTYGIDALSDGIPIVPAVVGMFAVPEMAQLWLTGAPITRPSEGTRSRIRDGFKGVLRHPIVLLRISIVGTVIGMIPGVGGTVASWVSYYIAKRVDGPQGFGEGRVEGVIAPEASVEAKEGGSLMPVLALGIPGSITTAILLLALKYQGIPTGTQLLSNNLDLVWLMIFALALANIVSIVAGLGLVRPLMRLTTMSPSLFAPVILVFALAGGYASQGALSGLWFALGFGLLGWLMVVCDIPRPPLLIGLILMPIAELNFHTAYQVNRSSYSFMLDPVVLVCGVILVIAFALDPLTRLYRRTQGSVVSHGGGNDADLGSVSSGSYGDVKEGEEPSYSLLTRGMFFLASTLVSMVFVGTALRYAPAARIFPLAVGSVLVVLSAVMCSRYLIRVHWRLRIGRLSGFRFVRRQAVTGWVLLGAGAIWCLGPGLGSAVFLFAVYVFRGCVHGSLVAGVVRGFSLGGCILILIQVGLDRVLGIYMPLGFLPFI